MGRYHEALISYEEILNDLNKKCSTEKNQKVSKIFL